MNKSEVLEKLAAKMQANRDEVKRQLEFVASLPGHEVHIDGIDLLHQLSVTWKEGQAIRELAHELVGIVYPDPPAEKPAEQRPS